MGITYYPPDRYICHAFVCDGGVVHPMDVEGTLTFTDIYVARPDGCKYSILEDWRHNFMVVDMFQTLKNNSDLIDPYRPNGYRTFPTYDAAIAASLLTY